MLLKTVFSYFANGNMLIIDTSLSLKLEYFGMHKEERGQQQMGPLWGVIFDENTSSKSKFRSVLPRIMNFGRIRIIFVISKMTNTNIIWSLKNYSNIIRGKYSNNWTELFE